MLAMKTLLFVTQNLNKVEDAKKLLPGFEIEHVDFDVDEIQSLDPHKIVEHKLKQAFEKVGRPCFVHDSSLSFDCLNGFPGPFIRYYLKDTVGVEKTCEIAKLFNQFGTEWTTVLGYFDGKETTFFEERVKGTIPPEPRGTNGYDWDVIFIPEGESRTFAEMSFEEKQSFAVTGKLLKKFEDFLNQTN
jgi:non-canonical purine NTP pyrophosphatase (RdgB/HAM1 family)